MIKTNIQTRSQLNLKNISYVQFYDNLSDPRKIFDRNEIASHLNLASHSDLARDVNIHVHRLRNKLTQGHNSASPIKAVRSQGYTLDSYLTYTFDGKEITCV